MDNGQIVSGGQTGAFGSAQGSRNTSRKVFIIGAVLIAIAFVGVMIFALVSKNKNGVLSGDLSMKQEYVNLVINGDINNSEIGEQYNRSSRGYYFNERFSEELEEWEAFYNKLNGYLTAMSEKGDADFQALIGEQASMLALFTAYRELEGYDSQKLVYEYVEGDFQKAQQTIREKLKTLDLSENVYAEKYAEDMTAILRLIGEYVEVYIADKCDGETVAEISACALSDEAEKENVLISNELEKAYNEIEYILDAGVQYYYELVYETAVYGAEASNE